MILAKKVRLYPSEIQEQKLWQSVGTARFIYNWTLSRQEENYKNGGKFISDNELRKEITQLKKDELSSLIQKYQTTHRRFLLIDEWIFYLLNCILQLSKILF